MYFCDITFILKLIVLRKFSIIFTDTDNYGRLNIFVHVGHFRMFTMTYMIYDCNKFRWRHIVVKYFKVA